MAPVPLRRTWKRQLLPPLSQGTIQVSARAASRALQRQFLPPRWRRPAPGPRAARVRRRACAAALGGAGGRPSGDGAGTVSDAPAAGGAAGATASGATASGARTADAATGAACAAWGAALCAAVTGGAASISTDAAAAPAGGQGSPPGVRGRPRRMRRAPPAAAGDAGAVGRPSSPMRLGARGEHLGGRVTAGRFLASRRAARPRRRPRPRRKRGALSAGTRALSAGTRALSAGARGPGVAAGPTRQPAAHRAGVRRHGARPSAPRARRSAAGRR